MTSVKVNRMSWLCPSPLTRTPFVSIKSFWVSPPHAPPLFRHWPLYLFSIEIGPNYKPLTKRNKMFAHRINRDMSIIWERSEMQISQFIFVPWIRSLWYMIQLHQRTDWTCLLRSTKSHDDRINWNLEPANELTHRAFKITSNYFLRELFA